MDVSLSCCVLQIIRSCVDLAKDVPVVFYNVQLFIYSKFLIASESHI